MRQYTGSITRRNSAPAGPGRRGHGGPRRGPSRQSLRFARDCDGLIVTENAFVFNSYGFVFQASLINLCTRLVHLYSWVQRQCYILVQFWRY